MDLFYLLEARIIFISILLLILYVQPSTSKQLSLTEGEDAHLTFPYPCDSTEVTLQHGYKTPFYRLTSSQNQGQRLRVENRIGNGKCSLDLTISDVMRNDEGTYISSVYKDGEILIDETHRIFLGIDYPPGKATCLEVEGRGRGGDWTKLECTADAGSLKGKIECYQGGEIMPSLTDPIETRTTLTQIMIVRKSQPAFCCSTTLFENKTRCECNDTALYISNDSIIHVDPCPTASTSITTMPSVYNSTENTNDDILLILTTYVPSNINKGTCISGRGQLHSIIVPIEIILLALMIVTLYVFYKLKIKAQNNQLKMKTQINHNHNDLNKNNLSLLETKLQAEE